MNHERRPLPGRSTSTGRGDTRGRLLRGGWSPPAGQEQLHDAAAELGVDWLAADQLAEHDRARQLGDRLVDVGVARKLTALDGALQRPAHRAAVLLAQAL